MSRKLWAFVLATILLMLHAISSDIWAMIALAYLGSQGAVDAAQHFATALGTRNIGTIGKAAFEGITELLAPETVGQVSAVKPVEAPPKLPPPPPIPVYDPITNKYVLPQQ